jgi:hypothetical protein
MFKVVITLDRANLLSQINKEVLSQNEKLRLQLITELAVVTPVDTGEAASSWTSKNQGKNKFSIENDEDYIKYLNAGSSQQAPAHFIESVVLKYGKPQGPVVEYEDQ